MLILENRKLAELKRTAGMQLHVPAGERERERERSTTRYLLPF
jgi:hypothetical protein